MSTEPDPTVSPTPDDLMGSIDDALGTFTVLFGDRPLDFAAARTEAGYVDDCTIYANPAGEGDEMNGDLVATAYDLATARLIAAAPSLLREARAALAALTAERDALRQPMESAGIDYCSLHHGIRNEDAHRCDNASDDLHDPEVETEDGEPRDCVLDPLFFLPSALPAAPAADAPVPAETPLNVAVDQWLDSGDKARPVPADPPNDEVPSWRRHINGPGGEDCQCLVCERIRAKHAARTTVVPAETTVNICANGCVHGVTGCMCEFGDGPQPPVRPVPAETTPEGERLRRGWNKVEHEFDLFVGDVLARSEESPLDDDGDTAGALRYVRWLESERDRTAEYMDLNGRDFNEIGAGRDEMQVLTAILRRHRAFRAFKYEPPASPSSTAPADPSGTTARTDDGEGK